MKGKYLTKVISVIMSMCICASMVTVSYVSADAAEVAAITESGNPLAAGAINMAVSKLYTFVLSATGTALTEIADATGSSELQQVVSFLDKWVFGNGQKRANAAITKLCQEILAELKVIETTLSEYTAQIEQSIGEQNFTEAMRSVNAQWETDVHSLEGYGIEDALNKYENYMLVAESYVDGKANLDDVNAAKTALFDAFCNIYKSKVSVPTEDNTPERLRERIFGDTVVNDTLFSAISSMKNNLLKETNYADVLAQFSYQALQYADEQYEFIKTGIDKQFTEIVMLEMMQEEFLAQYGDYLKEKYPDDELRWSGYQKLVSDFNKLNEEVAVNMSEMLDRELKVYPARHITAKLEQFPMADDVSEVTLHNTDFIEEYRYSLREHQHDTSYPNYVSEYENFNRVFTLTNTGINTFYIRTDEKDAMSISALDFNHSRTADFDEHKPGCDYHNLTERYYSDGTNDKLRCALDPSEISQLFNLNAYDMSASIPQNYLSKYYECYEGKPVFIIFPGAEIDKGTAFSTGYTTFPVIKASEAVPYADIAAGKTSKLSQEDTQKGKPLYDSFYSMIFVNEEEKTNRTVNTSVNGSGNGEIYLDSDGEKFESLFLEVGAKTTVRFKENSDNTVLTSLTLQRHDNVMDKNAVTSETVLLTRDQLASLVPDEDGYYTFDCQASYTDVTYVLNTELGHKVFVENTNTENQSVTLDGDNEYYLKGDVVSFSVKGDIEKIYIKYENVYEEVKLFDDGDGGIMGSFEMPNCDVTLHYHLYENGFCVDCGEYQPAVLTDNDVYEISNGGQFFWFASLVNGDREHAVFDKQNKEANGVLVADVDLENREWKPIADFNGGLDGQNHTLSGFKITKLAEKTGLFASIYGSLIDISVRGSISSDVSGAYYVGGIAAVDKGSVFSNVHSYVDITCGTVWAAGGVIGSIEDSAYVEKCTYNGSLSVNYSYFGIGGIVGQCNLESDKNKSMIRNSANLGNIFASYSTIEGGIIGSVFNYSSTVQNCYNYGSVNVKDGEDTGYCGGIIGIAEAADVFNCYYLQGSSPNAFGGNNNSNSITGSAISKDSEEFASGEVAYLLNSGETDGTQAWYQTIGEDDTPKLDTAHKTVYEVKTQLCPGCEPQKGYSNIDKDECGEHKFVDGVCIYCGLKEPEDSDRQTDTDDTDSSASDTDTDDTDRSTTDTDTDDTDSSTSDTDTDDTDSSAVTDTDSDTPFDKDDDNNFIIKTYDDLVELSKLVRSDYKAYGSANYILTNNIRAKDDSVWSMGIGSVSESKPFNGTFNGNGYCIVGLNVDSPEYGGLFEIIGDKGCVNDLFIIDCDYISSSNKGGSIAAVNNGTIDHCTNGINVGSAVVFTDPKTKKPIKANEFNSYINSALSGGIVAENNGNVIGCRNAGIVEGTECGGISAVNNGKIYGCANNGVVGVEGSSKTNTAGGITGKNGGIIESSYNSARVYGGSNKSVGSVSGLNGFDSKTDPAVNNVFYVATNGVNAVGTNSTATSLNGTNVVKKQSEMKTAAFADELNSVSDGSVRWNVRTSVNGGYPTIESNSFKQSVKSLNHGIAVSGFMHNSINISYDILDKNSDEYSKLSNNAGAALLGANGGNSLTGASDDSKILKGYTVSITDLDGNPVFAETWLQGDVEISVPVDREDVFFVGLGSDGSVIKHKPVSVKDGVATFSVPEPVSFVIAEGTGVTEVINNNQQGSTNTKVNTSTNKLGSNIVSPVKTGDCTGTTVLLTVLAVALLVIIIELRRRNKVE